MHIVKWSDPENKKVRSSANKAMLTTGVDFVAGFGGILVYYGTGFPQFHINLFQHSPGCRVVSYRMLLAQSHLIHWSLHQKHHVLPAQSAGAVVTSKYCVKPEDIDWLQHHTIEDLKLNVLYKSSNHVPLTAISRYFLESVNIFQMRIYLFLQLLLVFG